MTLQNPVKDFVLNEIRRIGLVSNWPSFAEIEEYARNELIPKKTKGYILLYNDGVITDDEIEGALHEAVELQARFDLDLTAIGRRYADHVGSPEVLAYAIMNGLLPEDMIQRINLDHEKDVSEFCEHYYRPGLLEHLRKKLLNPEPLPESDEHYYDPHTACTDCL